MNFSVEKLNSVKIKLTVEISAEEFVAQEKLVVNQLKRTVVLPGFRKGKAPEATIRKFFVERIREDVVNQLINKGYSDGLKQEKLNPVNDANVEIKDWKEDNSFTFTATFEIRPEFTPTGYKDLSLKREKVEVKPEAVEMRLKNILERNATYQVAEEGYAAQNGDMATVDFEGFIDGVAFQGGKAEGHPLMLGSGRMIPGFEEGVVGAKAGEERTIKVTFPENYRATDLAGKEAEFKIAVKEIKFRKVPEADEAFATEVCGLESIDELKEEIAKVITIEENGRILADFRGKVVELLLKANPFEVPESLVEQQRAHSIERLKHDMSQRGLDPVAAGIDKPEFLEEATKSATRSVRWAFLSSSIAQQESLSVTQADIDEQIKKIADEDGRPLSEIRNFFTGENLESLKATVRENKTFDAVLKYANVEEVSPEEWAAWKASA